MKDSYVRIRLTKEDKAEIKRMADAKNMSVSEYIRFNLFPSTKKVKAGA